MKAHQSQSPVHATSGVAAILGASAAFCLMVAPSHAVSTIVSATDVPLRCDTLSVPDAVHEIGWGAATTFPAPPVGAAWPFPADEELSSRNLPQLGPPSCVLHDLQGTPNAVVSMTNLSGRDWSEVWYVADHDTTLTNYDGTILSTGTNIGFPLLTFKIDSVGTNTPLIAEDKILDDIWQVGETWQFVIQDFINNTFPPSDLNSIGLDSGLFSSSGSIIAVPEPSGFGLALLGAAAVILRRRR